MCNESVLSNNTLTFDINIPNFQNPILSHHVYMVVSFQHEHPKYFVKKIIHKLIFSQSSSLPFLDMPLSPCPLVRPQLWGPLILCSSIRFFIQFCKRTSAKIHSAGLDFEYLPNVLNYLDTSQTLMNRLNTSGTH